MATREKTVCWQLPLIAAAVFFLALTFLGYAVPASGTASSTATFESLGLTNPANASVLVTASPGSSEFVQAVREARSEGKLVFAVAKPSELVAALPEDERTLRVSWPFSNPDETGPMVTSYYRTMTGLPVLDVMMFPLFEGSLEELLRSRDFEDHLIHVADFLQSHNLRAPERLLTDDELAVVSARVEAAGAAAPSSKLYAAAYGTSLGYVNCGASWPTFGRMYASTEAVFVAGDTNPSKDWYLLKTSLTMRSGKWVWGTDWQKDYHRFKFTPYDYDGPADNPVYTNRLVIQASPGATPSGGSVSVNVSTSGVGLSYSYPINDISISTWFNFYNDVKWQHTFAYNTASAIQDNSQVPAYIEEVAQGKYCKMHMVGTANWHWDAFLWWEDQTVNNTYNSVMIWAHP